MSVLDYEFGHVTSNERKRVATAVLKPWLAPGVLYKRVYQSLELTPTVGAAQIESPIH